MRSLAKPLKTKSITKEEEQTTEKSKFSTSILSYVNHVEDSDTKRQKELERLLREIEKVKKIERHDPFKLIVGKSRAIRNILTLVEKVKDTNSTVLITGETGTGKEIVARAIHMNSPRSNALFIPLNLGTIPEGLMESELFGHKKGIFTGATSDKKGAFEIASGGTIFLDEIGDINKACQVKLLRVLQEKRIRPVGSVTEIPTDVRVIAATQKNLEEALAECEFREDLYFRINVFRICMPPLREMKEDIPELVEHFAIRLCKELGKDKKDVSDGAMRKLLLYDWPGNMRQLENCMERAILLSQSSTIEASDIIFTPSGVEQKVGRSANSEKQLFLSALRGSKTVKEAMQKLNMRKSTFYDRIKRYGINPKSFLLH
jgi:transcriptional regulator with PAS, ATPase and Fis domain